MPPKKEATEGSAALLKGFEDRETKLIAAAFLSSIGPDKYDYNLMSILTGNTSGTLKKMWPPIKRKAIDAHESFGKWLGATAAGEGTAPAGPKPTAGGKKRKANHDDDEAEDASSDAGDSAATDTNLGDKKSNGTKKKAAPKEKKAPAAKTSRPRKQAKKAENDMEMKVDSGEKLAEEDDGAGKHAPLQQVYKSWRDADSEWIVQRAEAEIEV